PGGSPAARATSDSDGKVAFGILPAGSYLMTLSLRGETGSADIDITSGVGRTIQKRWDFQENKAYEPGPPATGRAAAGQAHIVVNSDGKHPLLTTIIRSKSNISNN